MACVDDEMMGMPGSESFMIADASFVAITKIARAALHPLMPLFFQLLRFSAADLFLHQAKVSSFPSLRFFEVR